ncbi:MAG: hypothetical protein EZS28_013894 [Streblomastix strix]|uniref:Uncharacterized protein n=1 Tax=Streblomastix strix TaxID=222440 RepID=A0A5J4W869_9EUKA|nr:MAG: hypothetical protein EZS28_013894 [Streblomastix strix]
MSEHNYYVFTAYKQVNGISVRFVTFDHGPENQDSTSSNVSLQQRKNEAPNGDMHTLSSISCDCMLSPFEISCLPCSHLAFIPNPPSELKWFECRFKLADERVRAARQQDQAKIPKTSSFTSLYDSSHGSILRKPELTPGQSLMIKDPRCPDAKNLLEGDRPTPKTSRGSVVKGPSGNVSKQKRKK